MIGVESLSLAKKLEATGFPQEQAEEVAKLVESASRLCFADLAKTQDVETLRVSLLQDNTLVNRELKNMVSMSKQGVDGLSRSFRDLKKSLNKKSNILNALILVNLLSIIVTAILYIFIIYTK